MLNLRFFSRQSSSAFRTLLVMAVLIFLVPAFVSAASTNVKLDSLYAVLDSVITRVPQIIENKENRIARLSNELVSAQNDAQRYNINSLLYEECSKYNYDKAMMFLNNNLQLAEKHNNKRWRNESQLRLTKLLVSTSAFKEADNIFDSIDVETLEPDLLRSYYSIRQLYYFYLVEFSDKFYANRYREKYDSTNRILRELRDSVSFSETEYEFLYSCCRAQQNDEERLSCFLDLIKRMKSDNPYYGATSASISNLYGILRNHEGWISYLIQAAISDLSIATKEHSALQELALYLSDRGDVVRAYKYINISMQDAIAFNARHRITGASHNFLLIQAAYKHKEDVERQTLRLTLIISIIIIVIILSFIIYIRRQSQKLLTAYTNLNEIHSKYKSAMTLLQQMSNSKDKYLVQILTLCTSFFKKQADFKKVLYKKIVSGKTEDIYKTLKLSINENDDLDTFYKLFDNAVYDLFPGFVERVNELLLPGKHIEIKPDKELSAELRILALIRLGITDNTQMSNFLNYSIGTIYTYRSKLRTNAKNPSNFESDIARIDKIELD